MAALKSQRALANIKSRNQSRYNASPGERVLGSLFPSRGVGWPGGWSSNRVEQILHLKNWTFVAIDAIGSLIGQLIPNLAYVTHSNKPDKVTEKQNRFDASRFRSITPSAGWGAIAGRQFSIPSYYTKSLSVIKPHEELEPLEYDHPLRRLIDNPNPVDTSFDLLYELDMFLELTGVAYLWAVPNGWGIPCELWVIPSHWVWPRVGGSKGAYVNPNHPNADKLIEYYEIRPWGGMGSAGMLKFPPEEVIRFHWKSPINKIDGYSKMSASAEWIDTEESMGKSCWAQFMNQALPSLWLELPPDMEDPNDDKIARIEAKVNAKFAGEFNQGKVLITSPGVKATPLSFSPEAMMYSQSREQFRDMILSVFRVPGAAVGLNKEMTYGCLDEQTECLTARGWKKYTELTMDTRIACYDSDTNSLIYRKPSRIIVKPYKGKMFHWAGQRFDSLLSPSHRVFVQRYKGGEQRYAPFEPMCVSELKTGRSMRILGAAPAACDSPQNVAVEQFGGRYSRMALEEHCIDPHLWLEFLGYYISEGYVAKPRNGKNVFEIDISQRMDSFLTPKIQECVDRLPFKMGWRRYNYAGNSCYHWRCSDRGLYEHLDRHCGQGSRNIRIPDYVKSWPAADLRILLDALIGGDGRKPRIIKKSGTWFTSYRTLSVQLADDVMEIAIKCGLSARISKDKTGEMFSVNITTRTGITVMPSQRTEEEYDGNIWCVTVPTGLFVVRRNGKAQVTGNSILAALAQFTTFAINPRLVMLGLQLQKHLAPKFYEEGDRPIKIWWDDATPPDPAQINLDISSDVAQAAITPNEIRALRGRQPYEHGGDDPLVSGPGGLQPLPLSSGEDLSELAELIAPMKEQPGAEGGQPGQGEEGAEGDSPGGHEGMFAPGIEEENGKPSKSFRRKGYNPIKALQEAGEWLSTHEDPAPMPGYGQIFIKENGSGECWYVGGDADEDGFVKLVQEKLSSIQGIDEVTCEAEEFPPKGEGWVQVYPKQREWKSKALSIPTIDEKLWEECLEVVKGANNRLGEVGKLTIERNGIHV